MEQSIERERVGDKSSEAREPNGSIRAQKHGTQSAVRHTSPDHAIEKRNKDSGTDKISGSEVARSSERKRGPKSQWNRAD